LPRPQANHVLRVTCTPMVGHDFVGEVPIWHN
jgi:hypothetical protein